MTLKFAHRGYKAKYPENTLYAFSKAIKSADGIEFDVHLSKDGIPVIIHDEILDRTTSGSGFVKDFTLKELKQFNAAKNFDGMNEAIPTLEEYFDLVKYEKLISNIELKTNIFEYPEIEKKVSKLIKKYALEKNCIVSSFNHKTLLRFKTIAPETPCGVLTSDILAHPVAYVQSLGCEYFHPTIHLIENDITQLHEQNIRINVWHPSVPQSHFEEYAKLIKFLISKGVDGIITDYEDLF